jgi:hypothetical protein
VHADEREGEEPARKHPATVPPVAKGIEYKSASFHVTEGKGLRDEDEQALQKLGDEGWEIVQIVPRQETNWVLVVFSRPRGTPGEAVT